MLVKWWNHRTTWWISQLPRRCAGGDPWQPAEGCFLGERLGGTPAAADRAPGVGGCLPERDAQRAETAAAENSHPRGREGAWMTRDQYRYGVWIFLWD